MKKTLRFLTVLASALMAFSCASDFDTAEHEPVSSVRLAWTDNSLEGDMVVSLRHGWNPAGTRYWWKCPSWPYTGTTNKWYSKTLHPNAIVQAVGNSFQWTDSGGTQHRNYFQHWQHTWSSYGAPQNGDFRDYWREDGTWRAFLLTHSGDPSGQTETDACVLVDRNDEYQERTGQAVTDNWFGGTPQVWITAAIVPHTDQNFQESVCPSNYRPPGSLQAGEVWNVATGTYTRFRIYPTVRIAGATPEDDLWYSAGLPNDNNGNPCIVNLHVPEYTSGTGTSCRTWTNGAQSGCMPAYPWAKDLRDRIRWGYTHYYMGKGAVRPNSVIWASCQACPTGFC